MVFIGSPLGLKFVDDVFRRQIQVDSGRREVVVSKEPLQGREADAFLVGGDSKRVAEDVRRNLSADSGLVRERLDHAPDLPAGKHLELLLPAPPLLARTESRSKVPLPVPAPVLTDEDELVEEHLWCFESLDYVTAIGRVKRDT